MSSVSLYGRDEILNLDEGKRLLAADKEGVLIRGPSGLEWSGFIWNRWLHRNGESLIIEIDRLRDVETGCSCCHDAALEATSTVLSKLRNAFLKLWN